MTGQTCAGHAEGVTNRDRTAVDVQALQRNTQLALAVQGLRSKGFVQLPQVDILNGQAVALEQLGHGKHGANAHLIGLATGHGKATESAQRLEAQTLGHLRLHHHAGTRPIGQLRSIACGDEVARALHRLQLGQTFQRGAGAVAVVFGGDDITVGDFAGFLVLLGHLGGASDDFVVEHTVGLRSRGQLLAAQRERVLVFTRDVVALGHHIGSVDHGHEQLGLVLHQPGVHVGGQVVAGTDARDGLYTASQHRIHTFRHHAARRNRNRLQTGGAVAGDGGARNAQRQLRTDHGLAAQVAPLKTIGVAAAEDQVLDHFWVHARALHRRLDRESGQLCSRGHVEFAAVRLGQRGTGGRNNDGFAHAHGVCLGLVF